MCHPHSPRQTHVASQQATGRSGRPIERKALGAVRQRANGRVRHRGAKRHVVQRCNVRLRVPQVHVAVLAPRRNDVVALRHCLEAIDATVVLDSLQERLVSIAKTIWWRANLPSTPRLGRCRRRRRRRRRLSRQTPRRARRRRPNATHRCRRRTWSCAARSA